MVVEQASSMIVEPMSSVESNYLNELYEDLYLKSAIDSNATIDIISWMEDFIGGTDSVNDYVVFSESFCLPGTPPLKLAAEFKNFWNNNTKQLSLSNILELRNSLYRFQSLS